VTTAVAVTLGFDAGSGMPDRMDRGANLNGVADSSQGTISFWIDPTALDFNAGDQPNLLASNTFSIQALLDQNGTLGLYTTDGASEFYVNGSTDITGLTGFHHLLMWWDTNAAPGSRTIGIALDGISETITILSDTGSAFSAPHTAAADWSILGANNDMAIAELWFDTVTETDDTKFRTALGEPVDLGSDGSIPTGVAPAVYLSIRDAQAAAEFATSRGTGGDFTITGSLDTAAFMDFPGGGEGGEEGGEAGPSEPILTYGLPPLSPARVRAKYDEIEEIDRRLRAKEAAEREQVRKQEEAKRQLAELQDKKRQTKTIAERRRKLEARIEAYQSEIADLRTAMVAMLDEIERARVEAELQQTIVDRRRRMLLLVAAAT
jgi:hypothetical protein